MLIIDVFRRMLKYPQRKEKGGNIKEIKQKERKEGRKEKKGYTNRHKQRKRENYHKRPEKVTK